jgi:two-component system sensor histidine kinase NreB
MSPSARTNRRKLVHERSGKGAQGPDLSRHLVRAQEEERKRISRELHDGTGQGLMVLRLYLGMLASETQGLESQLKIREALNLLDHTIEDLRRIVGRLSPRTLEEIGLLAAIRKEARDVSKNSGIKGQLELPPGLDKLGYEIEVAIYRSLQEALHNIVKHSQAKNFTVRLQRSAGRVCLAVEDDGVGLCGKRDSRSRTFGLLGMRERIAALGGKVQIRSREGKGTRIRVVLPGPAGAAARKWAAEGSVVSGAGGAIGSGPAQDPATGRSTLLMTGSGWPD